MNTARGAPRIMEAASLISASGDGSMIRIAKMDEIQLQPLCKIATTNVKADPKFRKSKSNAAGNTYSHQ